MRQVLTSRQREIYDYMEQCASQGFAPSYSTICERLGVTSKATVAKHIQAMEVKGAIKRSRVAGSFLLEIGKFEPRTTERKSYRTLPEELRWKIWRRDGFECLKCGVLSCLTIDHIVPSELGGTDDEANLQTLCRACNGLKKQQTVSYRVSGVENA